MNRRHDGRHGEGCFGCKVSTIQLSPSATPSRRNRVPPEPSRYNSWERGRIKDERGMPLLHPEDGTPVTTKQFAGDRDLREGYRRLKSKN